MDRTIKLFCLIIFFNQLVFSQNKNIEYLFDSILIVASNKNIEEANEYLTKVAWENRGKNPKLSLKLLYHTISNAENNQYTYILPKLYNYLGIIYRNLGNYGFAQASFSKALSYANSLNNKVELGFAYNNTGEILYSVREYQGSKYYFEQAEKVFTNINNINGLGYVYNQLGLYYYEKGEYRNSINYLHKSLSLRLISNDSVNIAATYRNLINSYLKINNLDSVAYLLVKLQIYAQKIKLPRLSTDMLEAFSNYYFQINKPDKAIQYAKEALVKASDISYWKGIMNITKTLYNYYYNKKDYQNAFYYLNYHLLAKDTLLNQNSLKDVYYYYNQYASIKELQLNNEIKFYKIFLYTTITIFVVLVIISIFFYIKYKKLYSNTYKRVLELENTLEDVKINYEEELKNKDKYLSIIAHDLKNPISAVKNISEMMINNHKKFSERELFDNLHLIKNTSNSLYNLLIDLLEWSRANTGQISINPAIINTEKIINDVLNYLILQANNKQIRISVDIEPNTYVYADYNMLNTILRNIISNAIKFTPISGQISIKAKTDKDQTIIQIADTGVGIPKDKLEKLFVIEKSRSTTGTNGETGTGLGLILVKDFVEKNNGTISVHSELNKGTIFTITLPNSKS